MSVYHIGCLHLGHEKLAALRRFGSSREHDARVLDGIRSVVTKRDKLFIHGDVTMESAEHYRLLGRIPGVKVVIMGNHDRHQDVKKMLEFVDGVCAWLSGLRIN